jgi:HAD superfamily hydrolase (TIGR01549 family)
MTKKSFGIIFDCDGTLADSLGIGLGSYNYALTKIGEPPRDENEIKKLFGSSADRIMQRLLKDDEKALKAFEFYLEHEELNTPKVHLHDGISELLHNLKAQGIPLGIVTGRHHQDLDFILKHHGLHHFFDAIVCDNHLPFSKPAPDGILLASSKLGLNAQDTFYVGDSVMDMQAAQSAGSKGIAALWDKWVKKEEMQLVKPFAFALHPQNILDIIISAS